MLSVFWWEGWVSAYIFLRTLSYHMINFSKQRKFNCRLSVRYKFWFAYWVCAKKNVCAFCLAYKKTFKRILTKRKTEIFAKKTSNQCHNETFWIFYFSDPYQANFIFNKFIRLHLLHLLRVRSIFSPLKKSLRKFRTKIRTVLGNRFFFKKKEIWATVNWISINLRMKIVIVVFVWWILCRLCTYVTFFGCSYTVRECKQADPCALPPSFAVAIE